jgi:hypothetical protein
LDLQQICNNKNKQTDDHGSGPVAKFSFCSLGAATFFKSQFAAAAGLSTITME